MNSYALYSIRALTNMHVGSGETNFNIIDNEVQRDLLNNNPTINSSSLKGALRKGFENNLGKDHTSITYIFGKGNDSREEENNGQGKYKFFSGNLLSIPVRSNKKQFFRCICPSIIENLIECVDNFNIKMNDLEEIKKYLSILKEELKKDKVLIFDDLEGLKIEGYNASYFKKDVSIIEKLEKIFGKDLAIVEDEIFGNVVKRLPVVARNHLENGISKNLWYEEIIPRETRFYFIVGQGKEENHKKKFEKVLSGNIIQIGANASIGYGYTQITKISK